VITAGWASGCVAGNGDERTNLSASENHESRQVYSPSNLVYLCQISWPNSDWKAFKVKVASYHPHQKRYFRADAAIPASAGFLVHLIVRACIKPYLWAQGLPMAIHSLCVDSLMKLWSQSLDVAQSVIQTNYWNYNAVKLPIWFINKNSKWIRIWRFDKRQPSSISRNHNNIIMVYWV
jgi:hypothetical protein